jgi:RNA ligase
MERFFDPNNLPDFNNPYYDPTPKTKGEWILATRGSFTSPQAIKGKEILDRHDISAWRKDNTYLFEIIFPENRIVVNYGDEEKLVVLGAIHTDTGDEIPDSSLFWLQESGFELVMTYKTWGETYDLLKEEISNDREGYVIKFKNGFRMKIKGEEYVRLHKILTNISNRDIWEYLKDNKPFDELLEKVPDEFNDWVKETVRDLTVRFDNIDKDYTEIYENLKSRNLDRKEFAIRAKQYRHSNILFNMLDGKEHKKNIWKLIYPTYSKPFKNENN